MIASCDHDALKRDPAAWQRLPYVGRQRIPADDRGPEELLELRNCTCGSTLALDVPVDQPSPATEGVSR